MIHQPRLTPTLLMAGWAACLAVIGLAIYSFGPAPSRIALLSVSDGMTMTFGSIYLLGIAGAVFLTLVLLHWSLGGAESFFELGTSQRSPSWFETSLLGRTVVLGSYGLVAVLSCYFLFVRLSRTLLSVMFEDSFIYFDGAQRLASGQQQHIDFHTPMGIFANLIPYWGMQAAHGLAGSMEWGFLIGGSILLAAGIPMIASRLSAAAAIPLVLYICLLAVVPLDVEAMPDKVTHAMFVNRLCWIAMTLVFLFFIEPRFPSKTGLAIDCVCLAALLFFQFYLKLSYFFVCVAFLPLLFISSKHNRWLSIISFSLFVIGVGVMEWIYGLNGPYFRDLSMAIHASGANRGSMLPKFVANIKEFALVAGAIALVCNRNAPNWRFLAYAGFVCLAGLAVIDQNTQVRGVVCLLAVLLVSQETLRRSINSPPASAVDIPIRKLKCLVCLGLVALFIMQSVVYRTASIAMIRSAVTQVEPDSPGRLQGMVLSEHLWKHFCAGRIRDPHTNKVIPATRHTPGVEEDYFKSILDGIKVLQDAGTSGKRVTTFDYVSPFSSVLSLVPPEGGHTCIDVSRTMCDEDFTPPEEFLGSVDYVMIPKAPWNQPTAEFLQRVYGQYLKEHFEPIKSSDYWVLWNRLPRAQIDQ